MSPVPVRHDDAPDDPGYAELRIDAAGRIVIPARVRAGMGVGPGDVLEARFDGTMLSLLTRHARIERAIEAFREIGRDDDRTLDDFLRWRREDGRDRHG